MKDRMQLRRLAETILAERKRREALFPVDIFDEYAWEMMLAIYVISACGPEVLARDLVTIAGCKPAVGERWITYLIDHEQVERTGQYFDLTPPARAAMEQYLQFALREASGGAAE